MTLNTVLLFLSSLVFALALGFYLITTLQWFSYKIKRILFHFTKPLWHVYFAIIPTFCYIASVKFNEILALLVCAIYVVVLLFWHKKLDKKLVLTARIKRYFVFLTLFALIFSTFIFVSTHFAFISPFLAVLLAIICSNVYEKFEFLKFRKKAETKLNTMRNLTIIQITASYGKTSIKNFLYDTLKRDFKCYKTPRSVNTLAGLIKDINDELPRDTEIYIAEAGARLKGDIAEITEFLRPQIVVVGEIGAQHIEYFKSIDNIRSTKLEALTSSRLKHAFCHSSTLCKNSENLTIYNENLTLISSNLDGIKFSLSFENSQNVEFFAPILGAFNASNLSVCIKIAKFLGLNLEQIQKNITKVKSVEHRLQKLENGGKIIIDDSFNGNLKGMIASYELVKNHPYRKVVITPGIVESTKEDNEILARKIDEIFDVVIITGELNAQILGSIISKEKLVFMHDKSKLVENLSTLTKSGDLVLFSNDAPSFI